jgi:hypothetical protein
MIPDTPEHGEPGGRGALPGLRTWRTLPAASKMQ